MSRARGAEGDGRARPPGWERAWIARHEAEGGPPEDLDEAKAWAARHALLCLEEAACDPEISPEARRKETVMYARLINGHVIDPAKTSMALRELRIELDNTRLLRRGQLLAGPERKTDPGRPAKGTPLS